MNRSEIVTRAVREKNPSILEESGYSLDYFTTQLEDRSCLLRMGESDIYCTGLGCSSDDCPFSRLGGNTIESARKWILSGTKRKSLIPEPTITEVADKEKHFKVSKDPSLADLISNLT